MELHFCARLLRYPNVLVMQVGVRNLGVRLLWGLIWDIEIDMLRLWSLLLLLWSLVATVVIAGCLPPVASHSIDRLNRRWINRNVSQFVVHNVGLVVRHMDLELPDEALMKCLRLEGGHWKAVVCGGTCRSKKLGLPLWQESLVRQLLCWVLGYIRGIKPPLGVFNGQWDSQQVPLQELVLKLNRGNSVPLSPRVSMVCLGITRVLL